MADVGSDGRGQLLLAGAFILAVALIGLTIVFTSGGYTTILTTQEASVDRGTDAITVRESLTADLDRYVGYANNDPTHTNYAQRRSAFQTLVRGLEPSIRDRHAEHGKLVDLDAASTSFEEGHEIELASDGSFDRLDSSSPAGSETIVTNAKTRNVTFVFSDVPTGSSSFDIRFESGGRTWVISVTTTGSTDWEVTVERPAGGYSKTCTRPGTSPDMVVNVDAATIDGNHCPALEAITFEDSYDVTVEGDLSVTKGRMWMTVEGPPPSSTYDHVIYSARVPFSYHSASVEYETELRIAPGEVR